MFHLEIIGGLLILSLVWNTYALGGTGTPGGWTNISITDQGVQNASIFAVSALAQQSNSLYLYQVGSILQASSQVVSGINYNISLVVQTTNCSSNASSQISSSCVAASQTTCVVIVWVQPWMTPPMKLTSSSCSSWTAISNTSSGPGNSSSVSTTTSPGAAVGGIPGGWNSVDVSDQSVQNVSKFAVSALAQQSNSPYLYQVGSILQASSQVVSGINYNISLVVQMTNCSRTTSSQNSSFCVATSQATCVVIVWVQPWMTPPMKLTSSSCSSWITILNISSGPGNSSLVSMTTSPGVAVGGIPGGWNNVDVSDQSVQNVSKFAVSALAQQTNSLYLYQVGSILQASLQVVSGINYNITLNVQMTNCTGTTGTQSSSPCVATSQATCVVIVWAQPWMTPSMKLTSSSCSSWTAISNTSSDPSNSLVSTTSSPGVTVGGIPGGWSNVAVSDQLVKNISTFAVGALAQQRNSIYLYQVGSILQASSQVVSGINYNISLVVQTTNCSSNASSQISSSCVATSQATCVVMVWVQPWMTPSMQLISSSCSLWTTVLNTSSGPGDLLVSTTTSPGVAGGWNVENPGGWNDVNVSDQSVQNTSMFAVSALAQQSNSLYLYQVESILQASSQVVSGINYNITLIIQMTNCSNFTTSQSSNSCVATNQTTCVVIVWVQPWMTPPMKLTSSLCNSWTSVTDNSSRLFNISLPGPSTSSPPTATEAPEWYNVSVTNPGVQRASAFAAGELTYQNNSLCLYQVGSVLAATAQDVSEKINYVIVMKVEVTNSSTSNGTRNNGSCTAASEERCVVMVEVLPRLMPRMNLTYSACIPWGIMPSSVSPQTVISGATSRFDNAPYVVFVVFAMLSEILLFNHQNI